MEIKPNPDTQIATSATEQSIRTAKSIPLIKVGAITLFGLCVVIGVYYAGMKWKNRTDSLNEKESITSNTISQAPATDNVPSSAIAKKMETNTSTPTDPPEKFGFTKTITMESVGVRALFPPNVTVSQQENNFYVISVNANDQVTFALKPYDGGGRRAWFAKEYPWASEYQTDSFSGTGHSGYIAYAVTEKDLPGPFFYFAVVGDRMLVVSGNNYISNNLNPTAGNDSIFFAADIQKFKSFLSRIELITPQQTVLETYPEPSDLFRWSDARKTIWEDVELGLKITAPDWTESRFTKGRDANGKFIFTEWTRAYPNARTDSISYLSETVLRTQVTGGYMSSQFLTQLPVRFQGKTFSEVVDEALIAAGFCASEWKNSKVECENPTNYCYTRDEVVEHLTMQKSVKIGSLDAQLRSMDRDFSNTNDCRSEDVWLIRGANGRYISSGIAPDSEAIRLEAL